MSGTTIHVTPFAVAPYGDSLGNPPAGFAVDPFDPARWLMADCDGNVRESTDEGRTWTQKAETADYTAYLILHEDGLSVIAYTRKGDE